MPLKPSEGGVLGLEPYSVKSFVYQRTLRSTFWRVNVCLVIIQNLDELKKTTVNSTKIKNKNNTSLENPQT